MVKGNADRLHYIDELKGIAIILVVWGHCGANNYFYNVLYYLHLPIFIILTGMLLNHGKQAKHPKQYILKIAKNLMYPFIAFGVLSILLDIYLNAIANMNISIIFRLKEMLCLGYDACWYLPALFIGETLAILVIYVTEKLFRKKYMIIFFLGTILFIAGMLKTLLWNHYGQYSADSFMGSWKMLGLLITSRSLFFSAFVLSGHCLFPCLTKIQKHPKSIVAAGSSIIFFIMVAVTKKAGFVDLRLVNWNNTVVYWGCSIIIAVSLIIFVMTVNKKNRPLEFLGKNSIIIMGVHMSLQKVWLAHGILQGFFPAFINMPTLYSIIAAGLVIMLCLPYIRIFNTAFPYILSFDKAVDILRKVIIRNGGTYDGK